MVPVAVGVFLSLVLYELIPETLAFEPTYGGIAVAVGFIAFYILSAYLHKRYHCEAPGECERKGAAMLLLIGDAVHNVADGVILGTAFLIDPAVGTATAIGLALHEIPQEIVEFGVLVRAGNSRIRAAILNLISASSIVFGTALVLFLSEHVEEYLWVITGIAAGNLLYLAASDLLPRIHSNLPSYGNIWKSSISIILGFVVMTLIVNWAHGEYGHGHVHDTHDHHGAYDAHSDEEYDEHEEHYEEEHEEGFDDHNSDS